MDLFTLVGKIVLDADGFSEKIDGVLSKVESMGTGLQRAGEKISSVGSKLTIGVTAPIAGLGVAAVKTAADFESTMSQVSAISGATGDDFKKLEDLAKKMGETTKFSASEAAEALTYMAMAGWKTDDMLNGLEGIMNLAAASGEDLGTTSDIVTDALTAFGLSASDSGHFADILATASSNANTNVSMMGETFKYVAPVAGALGYSAEDTAEAIGLMANAGIKSSQAGTSLRSILSNLQGEVIFCGAGFGEMTVQTTKADGSMRSLGDILEDCRKAFANMSESERAANAEAVVGREAMSGFLALMTAAPKDIDKLNEAISNCNGSAKDMADTMNDNLSGQITLLKSQLEALAIQFITLIMPYLKQGVEWLSKLCTWISGLDDGTKKMILTIAGIAAAAGPVLTIFGKGVTLIGTLISAGGKLVSGIGGVISVGKTLFAGGTKIVTGIGSLVAKLGGGLLPALAAVPGPVWIVIAVIGALVAAGVALYKNWDEVKEFASRAWDAVCGVIGTAAEKIKGFFQGIADFIGNNWQGILLLIVNPIAGGFKLLYDNCETFRNFIDGFFGNIRNKYHEMVDGIKQKTSEMKDEIVNKYHEIKDRAVEKFEEMKESAVAKFTALKDGAAEKIEELRTKAAEKIQNLKDSAVTHFEELREKTSAKVSELKEKVVTDFHELKEQAAEKVADLKEKWGQRFEEAREKIVSEVTELKERSTEKINEFKESAVARISEFKDNAVNKFHEFKNESVSRLQEVAQKGVEGFNSIKEKGSAAIETLRNTAASKFSEMGSTIHDKFNAVGEKIVGTFTKCRETVRDIVEKVKGFFNFEWKLPDIKLPHFSIEGEFSLSPPSIPHLGVEWYAKAMDNPMIMTRPTAFGISPTGQIMAGGEAGSEVVSGTNTLMSMISAAVSQNNDRIYGVMERIYVILAQYLPELSGMQVCLDTGALVGELAQPLNDELGWIAHTRGRRK
ncbi:MAG: phage tail tape measure protein [Clostridia bacterium]|nr:phage tail tape measure protein [Clostridia bacterium]